MGNMATSSVSAAHEARCVQLLSSAACTAQDSALEALVANRGHLAHSFIHLRRQQRGQQDQLTAHEQDVIVALATQTQATPEDVLSALIQCGGDPQGAYRLLSEATALAACKAAQPAACPPGGTLFGERAEAWGASWRQYEAGLPRSTQLAPSVFGAPVLECGQVQCCAPDIGRGLNCGAVSPFQAPFGAPSTAPVSKVVQLRPDYVEELVQDKGGYRDYHYGANEDHKGNFASFIWGWQQQGAVVR